MGLAPQDFGITLEPRQPGTFAHNDIGFTDPVGTDHDLLGLGLKKAIYNFMHGIGLDEDVRSWFDHPTPKARVPKNRIAKALMAG